MSGRTRLGVGSGVLAVVTTVYLRVVRPWQLTWGATQAEVAAAMPGDELVARPVFDATRAITIQAPPAAVWPWLVQVGVGRAGWYSYDLLDNLGRPSADRILPEHQGLTVGDVVPMSPDGTQGVTVQSMHAPNSMVWGSPGTSWAWQLEPLGHGATRLVTRIRSRPQPTPFSLAFAVLLELADIWMLRRMLLTVRRRAAD
ncbi:hypothetical protein [Actinotalea sp. K2]|uniref:hypothetical protein n=1 Tax=Actinotalea sp. K2 TaxID=2939438 RepID=UPI002016EE24|nr:hypothetical protein [Actinotalea sp. K2]MCL3861173.1 hypothetical protein [Actinotalea sp. K2]